MKKNYLRGGCIDVFHAFLVEGASFAGEYDFPVIKETREIPRKVIVFSKALKEKNDYNQWVCFYEDDHLFERFWNNPRRYLSVLSRFDGVILPDFSVYSDMPLAMQIWNIYRSRAIGCWLQKNGVKIIPNIRFGASPTLDCCCDGISKYGIISVGTLGCLKDKQYREVFEADLEYIVNRLKPEVLILYGSVPANIAKLKKEVPKVVTFKPDYSFFNKGDKE